MTGTAREGQPGWRLPAREIEHAVAVAASKILQDSAAVVAAIRAAGVAPHRVPVALKSIAGVVENLRSETEAPTVMAALVDRVALRRDAMDLILSLDLLITRREHSPDAPRLTISRILPMHLRQHGREMRVIIEGTAVHESRRDMGLIKVVARAVRWFEDLASRHASITDIATREGVTDRYVGQILPVALLAPEIIEAIVAGRQPPQVTTKDLIARAGQLPLQWSKQATAWQ